MLLVEMIEVKKPYVIYEDNQGTIFLEKNRQVGNCTKHIDICHHFLQDMVEEMDIDIQYIRDEENPAHITTKNTFEENFERHLRMITQGELWELLDTGTENIKNTRVMNNAIAFNKTEYSSQALNEVVNQCKQ